MEAGLGALRMAPSEFWNCTHKEIKAAIDGFNTFNGGTSVTPLTAPELKKMMVKNPDKKHG